MSAIEPPPDWYMRVITLRAMQGLSIALPTEPEAEPANVHSIALARTKRAIAQMMRRREGGR
jgi:hypothetical protein